MITNAIIIISIIIFILINFIDKSNYDKTSLAIKYGAFYMPRIEVKKECRSYRYYAYFYECILYL